MSYTIICVTRTDDSLPNIKKDLEEFKWKMVNPISNIEFHRAECLLFSGHLLAVRRSVISPCIIQINARRRVSLVKINARFFP